MTYMKMKLCPRERQKDKKGIETDKFFEIGKTGLR